MSTINFRSNVPSILGNNAPNNKYKKPVRGAGIYTSEELANRRLQWKLACIKRGEIIDAFAELIINDRLHVIEIYNVYTHPSVRRTGRASVLINAIKTRYPGYTLWLGILPESRAINNSKAKLYGKLNFTSNIKITNITPSGKRLLFKFIQLVYKPGKMRNGNGTVKVRNKIETLSKVKLHQQISIVVTIPYSYLQAVKRFTNINVPTETGGTIAVNYTGFHNGIYQFMGQETPTRTNPGFIGIEGGHAVQIPPIDIDTRHLISWHTHPKICYQQYNACLGLPSTPDFISFLHRYIEKPREICTLVFASEAIYVIYIKRGIKKAILEQTPQNKQRIYSSVSEQLNGILNPIHSRELQPLNSTQKNTLITDYKNAINRITLGVRRQVVFKLETYVNMYENGHSHISRGSNLNAYGRDLVLKVPYDIDFLQNVKKRQV